MNNPSGNTPHFDSCFTTLSLGGIVGCDADSHGEPVPILNGSGGAGHLWDSTRFKYKLVAYPDLKPTEYLNEQKIACLAPLKQTAFLQAPFMGK
jgi:hypothetical protein